MVWDAYNNLEQGCRGTTGMAEQTSVMEAGDRAPNFQLKDQTGKLFEFYTAISGGSIVLVVVSINDQENPTLLCALNEKLPEFEAQNAHLFVVCNDTVESHATLSRELGLHFPLIADPDGQVSEYFLSAAQGPAPVVFVLDPNQRLVSLKHGAGEGAGALTGHALQEVTKIAPKGKPRIFSEMAPALFIPNVFSREFCRHLIERWETGGHTEGIISTGKSDTNKEGVDYGFKRRQDHFIETGELGQEISNILGSRLGPEVEKIHYFDNWTFEDFRIGCYEDTDAGFFIAHRDNFNEKLKNRRYAVTLNLNAEDYEGGDLRFPEYGQDLYRPPTGGAVVFSCSLLHEVLPVTKGRRFVFLTFLNDPKPQQA
jgi:peroxiredoxin/predicted 2-oxoglutarate/Fe(II)-dependent dioxygenase YbiX